MTEELKNDVKKLRFLDENGETYPDWEEKQLGETEITFTTGKRDANEASVEGEYNFYTCSSTVSKISRYSFEGPSLLIAGNGVIGDVKYYDNKFDAYQRVYVLQNLNEFEHNYLKAAVKDNLEKTIRSEQMGSTLKYIRLSTLTELKIFIPSLPEQSKIAEFLSNLDERIEAQSKLVELLKKQKQGYSQRLFNGSLRFKKDDGTDYEDWEEKRFSDFLKIPNDKPAKNVDYNKLITVGWWGKGLLKSQKGGSFESGATNFYKRRKGQFIYGKQAVFNGALGIVGDNLDGYYSSKDNPALDFYGNIANPKFILDYMLRPFFYRNFEKLSAGTGSKRVKESEILKLVIALPSLSEQEKIAAFLSSLDEIIEQQLNKLEQLKLEKQAYMQRVMV